MPAPTFQHEVDKFMSSIGPHLPAGHRPLVHDVLRILLQHAYREGALTYTAKVLSDEMMARHPKPE